jgi:ABC-2 type transport system permease protein
MNITFKIVRTELQNLFYSPVAWFLTVVFLIQCAYFYMAILYPYALGQDWMIKNDPSFKNLGEISSLTKDVFFGGDSIVTNVHKNLYLFIPLLTMGLISREINNGTIKLLYSSPIKLRHIVLGKYLAVMVFCLLLIGILAFFMVLGAFHIKSIDYGLCLSALLGFCLLAGAYSAIGLFMSSLSNYQIVSGIATFMVFFILTRIGGLWQKYDLVRDLTWFLSIGGRTEKMLAGLITTRDVIYFIIIILMFLAFTVFKLRGEKESKPWAVKAARYLGVIAISLLIGYITSRPAFVGYLDATAEDVNTISPKVQDMLKKMGDEPLEITLYANLFGGGVANGLPEARNAYLYGFWDKYVRFKPDIKFKYVYYYDNDDFYKNFPGKTKKQVAGICASGMLLDSAMFLPPEEIRKQIDPYSENLKLFMTARFKGDTINLRTYADDEFWPNQQEMASKFKRLLERKVPKVYFLTGNLERSIIKRGEREYSEVIAKNERPSLVNAAFDVDTLSLEKQDIPAEVTALVLADPKRELGKITLAKLEQYIAKGGNLFVLGEPGKHMILNPVLQQLGVQQLKGQLVQLDADETPDKITPYRLKAALDIIQQDEKEKQMEKMSKMPDNAYKHRLVGAAALSYRDGGSFKINPISKTLPDETEALTTKVVTSSKGLTATQKAVRPPVLRKTWLKMGRLVTDSVPPVFTPEDGDIKAPSFVTGLSLTRQLNNKEQRIIVLGDADCMTHMRGPLFGNSFYNWFDYGEHPVFIPVRRFKDNLLTVTGPTAKILSIACVWVLPGLLLLTGTVLLIRRKRK